MVLEPGLAIQQVVEMHVAELVNPLFAVAGRDKRHFEDQDIRLVHRGAGVEALGRTVAEIGQAGNPQFAGDLGAGQPQVADLLARKTLVFLAQLLADSPDDEPVRREGVRGG